MTPHAGAVDFSGEKMKEIEHICDTGCGDRVDASEAFLAISANTDDTTSGDKLIMALPSSWVTLGAGVGSQGRA